MNIINILFLLLLFGKIKSWLGINIWHIIKHRLVSPAALFAMRHWQVKLIINIYNEVESRHTSYGLRS